MKKKKINWANVVFWLMIYLGMVFMGFVVGMSYQQRLTAVLVTEVLSYSDIEVNVNFNETKFMEELNNTFIPAWKEAFNQTAYEQLNLSEDG